VPGGVSLFTPCNLTRRGFDGIGDRLGRNCPICAPGAVVCRLGRTSTRLKFQFCLLHSILLTTAGNCGELNLQHSYFTLSGNISPNLMRNLVYHSRNGFCGRYDFLSFLFIATCNDLATCQISHLLTAPYFEAFSGSLRVFRIGILAAKPLRPYPQLSQISEAVFVFTCYQVFLPTLYPQPVFPRR
jgi:hypothetical protein